VHDYTLLDPLYHEKPKAVKNFLAHAPKLTCLTEDWFIWQPERSYDLVIANDLFPNVDQRLELFLARYLPFSTEIRLSLTFHNKPRFYTARRVDGDEILHVLSWDGAILELVLARFAERIVGYEAGLCLNASDSVFPNGRQIAVVKMRGDA